MKNKYNFLIIIIAGILVPGIYCNIGTFNKGSLSLKLSYSSDKQNASIGTRLPEINNLIQSFEIFLNGPYGEKVSRKTDNIGNLYVEDLTSGEWIITATAVNIDKIPVGSGNASVIILPRKNVDFKITLSPYNEIGTLKLSISCEPLLAKSALIKGSLDQSIGSAEPIDFSISGKTPIYENKSIYIGYYILTIKLFNNGISCGGAAVIIGIVSNKTASASVSITTSSSIGGAGLVFVPQIKDTVKIVLKDTVMFINQGRSFNIIAEPVKTADAIYSWFIDGVFKESGLNYNYLTIPSGLAKGHHRADVAIFTTDGFAGWSAAHSFDVL
jgi:hypothetical protein